MIVINNAAGGSGSSDMPVGAIVLWYGTAATVPSGYAICNGSGGLPDFRGKLIRGASSDSQLLTSGGALTHLHAAATSAGNSVSHGHAFSFTLNSATFNYGTGTGTTYASSIHSHGTTSGDVSDSGNHTHTSTGSSDLSSSLPYCKSLYWIKRIA